METQLLRRMTGEELLLLRILDDGTAATIGAELDRRARTGSRRRIAGPARARTYRLAAGAAPVAAA